MRLHSPIFQRRLRRRVRETIRSSKALKGEFRRANKLRRHYNIQVLARPALSAAIALVVWLIIDKTGHPATALAALNLWSLASIFIQARSLLLNLYGARDLPALVLLPLPEVAIFRWELQKFIRGSIWLAVDVAIGLWVVASPLPIWTWAFAPLLGLVAWLEILALAPLCIRYLPRFPYRSVPGLLFILPLVLVFGRENLVPAVLGLLDRVAPRLNLLLPTGWPVSLFELVLPEGHWTSGVLLVPIVALIWTLKRSLARLQANYHYEERLLPVPRDLLPESVVAAVRPAGRRTEPLATEGSRRVGPTAIEEIIRSGQLFRATAWQQAGWFEARLWRWLKPRERILTEFVFPTGFEIGTPWKKIARNQVVAAAAALLAGWISPDARFWVLGIGLFVTVSQALAQILASGRAFQLIACSGVNIPIYADYPIGFHELAKVLFKCSLVQFPLLLPFSIAATLAVFYIANQPLVAGAMFGIKAAVLLVASRFFFITFGFSSGTNDSILVRFRSVAIIFIVVMFGLGFVGLGAASLFVPNQLLAWILGGVAALESYIFFRLYGWFYHANCFDLMALPRR